MSIAPVQHLYWSESVPCQVGRTRVMCEPVGTSLQPCGRQGCASLGPASWSHTPALFNGPHLHSPCIPRATRGCTRSKSWPSARNNTGRYSYLYRGQAQHPACLHVALVAVGVRVLAACCGSVCTRRRKYSEAIMPGSRLGSPRLVVSLSRHCGLVPARVHTRVCVS